MSTTKTAPRRKKRKTRQRTRTPKPTASGYTFDLRTKKGTLAVFDFIHWETQSKGWNHEQLAGRADMSKTTIGRWLGDDPPTARGPFARQLVAVFNALGFAVVTKAVR